MTLGLDITAVLMEFTSSAELLSSFIQLSY